jgi:hypothetical protein
VVFPDPLGPFKTVAWREAMDRETPLTATNSLGRLALKTLLTSLSSIIFNQNVPKIRQD